METDIQTRPQIVVSQDWQQRFDAWLAKRSVTERSRRSYAYDLAVFLRWYQDENRQLFSPEYLTSWDLGAFRQYSLKVRYIKPATWNRRRSCLSLLATWARKEGLIQTDPIEGVDRAEMATLAPRWLTRPDYARLMRQIEIDINGANTPRRRSLAQRDAAMVALMAFAGLRVGEVISLLRMDIDIGERTGKVRIRCGKGEKYGVVPLNKEVRKAMAIWLEQLPQDPETPVFALTARDVQKRVKEIREKAGVQELTPHRLRHTFGKHLIDAGRDLTVVQSLMRHNNVNTTIRYTLPGEEELAEAVEDGYLGERINHGRG